jgi:hypothetical protein
MKKNLFPALLIAASVLVHSAQAHPGHDLGGGYLVFWRGQILPVKSVHLDPSILPPEFWRKAFVSIYPVSKPARYPFAAAVRNSAGMIMSDNNGYFRDK